MGNIPTTFIQLAGAGSKIKIFFYVQRGGGSRVRDGVPKLMIFVEVFPKHQFRQIKKLEHKNIHLEHINKNLFSSVLKFGPDLCLIKPSRIKTVVL